MSGDTKRNFSARNRGIKRAITRDGGKINKVRERNRIFQSKRTKIRLATRYEYIGTQEKTGIVLTTAEKSRKPSKIH